MINDFLGPKPVRSVAAFLWMPQFRLSFQHMSHLAPVFMRTLAMVFVQAGMLPRNHPALMYGVEGVRKYRASEIIGEAWFALRTTRASASQWGVFVGLLLMMAMIIGSVVTFLMTLAFGAGTAQAQLFSHPLGDSSVDAYPGPGGSPFDTIVAPAGSAQGDYGIMMLDKVLRAGASGQGVPLQNATRALMEIYNSGILVIASIIIFWMIVNIVVDTAKSGQVGGGRHNMVWVPIRIVFALALLVPLGSTGYSSGQFMVMKVAEWGSNFGTNAWGAYVDAVADSQNLLASDAPFSPTSVVVGYQRLWVCMAAFNANEHMGNGNLRVTPEVGAIRQGGERVISFSHQNLPNACGAIRMEETSSLLEMGNAMAQDTQTRAALTFKNEMRRAYTTGLRSLEPNMRAFACKFLQARPGLGTSEEDMGAAGCQAGPANYTENDIPYADLASMIETFGANIQRQYTSSFERYSEEVGTAMMKDRGWAGMGAWYHRISQLNGAVGAVMQAPIALTGPAIEGMSHSEAIKETNAILTSYDEWWTARSIDNAAAVTVSNETGRVDTENVETGEGRIDAQRAFNQLRNANYSNALDVVVDMSGANTRGWMSSIIAHTGGASHGQTYPLAMLSNIGGNIFWTGSALVGLPVILNVVIAAAGNGLTGQLFSAPALAANPIFPLVAKIGFVLMSAGMMLKFYIPLIPFVRTIFSVLTWIISVFEAVVMVPFAALSLLSTDGEGLGSSAQRLWPLWLNILVRPILTVMAFVGAMLVFNAFVAFVNDTVLHSIVVGLPSRGWLGLFTGFIIALVYVFVMYTVANTVFKMLDLIPSALMRWMGGSADQSFDDHGDKAILLAASNMISQAGSASQVKGSEKRDKPKAGAEITAP